MHLARGELLQYPAHKQVWVISIVAGSLRINKDIYNFGTKGLIPWKESCEILAIEPSIVLVTDPVCVQ